jgi:hypothetical protein
MASRLVVVVLLASSFRVAAFADEPIRIEIESSWEGLGAPADSSMVITGRNGKYATLDGRVNAGAVSELLAALDGPLAYYPSLQECGVDEAWIARNYERGLEDYTHRKIAQLSSKQVELFKGQLTNPESARAAFSELFKNFHTDDYPFISVKVQVGHREYGIQSSSQYPFMLPWEGTDRPRGLFSCRVSRAISALLPPKFPNRTRLLLGDYFRWRLTEQIMQSIRPQWNLLDTEFRVGSEIAPVVAKFSLLESEISNLSSIDLDGGQAWNALMRSSDFPFNLTFGVSLSFYKKPLRGVDALLADLPKYGQFVLSVPWLRKYLEDHPKATAELRYVNGRSLSLKAQRDLSEDLEAHGKPELAKLVSDQAANCAFLEVNDGAAHWSRLLVFPDRQTLLWHFQGDSVLGFPASEFSAWDFYGWRSVGVLIAPDGTIEK